MHRLPIVAVLLLGAISPIAPSLAAADLAQQIEDELSMMDLKGSAFDSQELHALSVAGLQGVLDRFFPDLAASPPAPPPKDEIERLIAQLGNEEFRIRESATEQLIARGKPCKDLLVAAADSDDAEVRLRARRIMAAWEPRAGNLVDRSLGGFWNYAEGIKDPERLEMLARRIVGELKRGWPEGTKLHLLRLCVAGLAKGGDDASCDLLRPLIAHDDARVAKLVTETVGSYKTDPRYFPRVLIDALASSRDEVTQVAIRWSQNCQDPARKNEVRQALREIFDKRAGDLKFQACLPLFQDHDDADAWQFLIDQTQSKESLRAASALSWLADAKHSGRAASPELIEKLSPNLVSPTLAIRWGATKALGTHAGEEVARHLLPLLADSEQSVADEARRGLSNQSDRALVRQLLAEAAQKHADQTVRTRAGELLKKLAEQ